MQDVKIFEYPNATVRVFFPDITAEEREKRTKEIKRASSLLIKSALLAERSKLTEV